MSEPKSQNRRNSASGVPLTADHDTDYEAQFAPLTARQRHKFLSELALTGDIVGAAAAAGRDEADFFVHRQASVGFRAEWDAAMDIAYMRMESVCVAVVIRALTRPSSETEPRLMALYHRLALSLMAARRAMTGSVRRTASASQNSAGMSAGINNAQELLSKLSQMRKKKEQNIANLARNG